MLDLRTKDEKARHVEIGAAAEHRAYRYMAEAKQYDVQVSFNRYSPVDAIVRADDATFAVDVKRIRMELFYQPGFHLKVDQVRKLREAAERWRMRPLYFFMFSDGVGIWCPTDKALEGRTIHDRGPDPRQGGDHYRLSWSDVRIDPEWEKFWKRKI